MKRSSPLFPVRSTDMTFIDFQISETGLADVEMASQSAIDYELADRFPSHTFRDSRSASKIRQQRRAKHDRRPSNSRLHSNPPRAKSRRRRARHHAYQHLRDDIEEAQDPSFQAYVFGAQAVEDQDLDDHVFGRCELCWQELHFPYLENEMFDGQGWPLGQWSDEWEVPFGDVEEGRFGFAGRAKVGVVFLMGGEDWRVWPERLFGPGEDEGENWEDQERDAETAVGIEAADDAVSEAWSWDELSLMKSDGNEQASDWEVVSSCSSWSLSLNSTAI